MAGMMKTIADDPIEAVRKEERRIDQRRQGLNTTLVASSAQELHAAARALAAIGVGDCLAKGLVGCLEGSTPFPQPLA